MAQREQPQVLPGFVDDIQTLLENWQQRRTVSFSVFKDVWKELQFSYIHKGSAPNIAPENYTQALFQATIRFLPHADSLEVRVGVLYTLYCLYQTQGGESKQKIVQSMRMYYRMLEKTIYWKEMLKLYGAIVIHKVVDALYVWKLMRDGEFYVFSCAEVPNIFENTSANHSSANSSIPAEVINVDTLTGVVDVGMIEDISSRYSTIKEIASNSIPSLLQSCQVIDPEFVGEVKETFQQAEQQQYVARQLAETE